METVDNNPSLQDTYEYLKIVQREMQSDIDELTEAIKNNPSFPLNEEITKDHIAAKRLRFLESLKKLVLKENPKNYPLPGTKDLEKTVVQNLETETLNMNTLLDETKKELSRLKNEVSYYEDKISGYDKMRKAASNANEVEEKVTYQEEYALVKRIFGAVKADLSQTVDMIFPSNDDVIIFLMELSRKQQKGGDDVYQEITDKNFAFVTALNNLGIVVFHPNNPNKCKMANLL